MIRKSIPSIITLGNLACGFLACLVEPRYGLFLLLFGGILDVFDGLVARMLKAQSSFGKELDSLADVISFGIAPAFLMTQLFDSPLKYICLIPVLTGAIRLARFNVQESDQYYFDGLAIPGSALVYISILLINTFNPTPWITNNYFLIPLILIPAFLNVSTISMFSFKGLTKDRFTPIFFGILAIIGIALLFVHWTYVLLGVMLGYILLSVIYHILLLKQKSIAT